MVRIANNHDFTVNTNLRIIISGGGVNSTRPFPCRSSPAR